MKTTRWFGAKVDSPKYPGVYQVSVGSLFSYYDGEAWHGTWWTIQEAYEFRFYTYGSPVYIWRGLAKKP